MFPVRQVHFDGLKLDRDIVGKFVANDNDYKLIKAIQIYSDMTGSECIAEGVDSEEKFEKLVALGVKVSGILSFPRRERGGVRSHGKIV